MRHHADFNLFGALGIGGRRRSLAHPPLGGWANVHLRAPSRHFAHQVSRSCSFPRRPAGFRFRRRKAWGFKASPSRFPLGPPLADPRVRDGFVEWRQVIEFELSDRIRKLAITGAAPVKVQRELHRTRACCLDEFRWFERKIHP